MDLFLIYTNFIFLIAGITMQQFLKVNLMRLMDLEPNYGKKTIIADRSYCNVLFLNKEEIDCKIPPVFKRDESQHTIRATNESRLITKSRWVVEARNGHIKQYSVLRHDGIISTTHIPNLRDFYFIAGAIINCYRNLILMEEATLELAHRMIEKVNTPNVVQARIEQETLFRKNAVWNKLN